MGGYGSGRVGERPVNDESLMLPFDQGMHSMLGRVLRNGRRVARGTIRWSSGQRQIAACGVALIVRDDGSVLMVLSYSIDGETTHDPIRVVFTETPFGRRPWWVCPGCAGRCLRLYNTGGRLWRCRQCQNVTYRSSNESDKRLAYDRLMRVVERPAAMDNLILALKGCDRIRAKIDRDRRAAERWARKGKPGRPRGRKL